MKISPMAVAQSMKISPMAVAQSMMPPQAFAQDSGRHIDADEFFRPYEPPKGVLPAGQTAKIAMDEAGVVRSPRSALIELEAGVMPE